MPKKFNIVTFWRNNHGDAGENEYLIPALLCEDGFQMIVSAGPMSSGCSPQKYLKSGRYKEWEVFTSTQFTEEPLLDNYREPRSRRYSVNVPTATVNELVERHGGLRTYAYDIYSI